MAILCDQRPTQQSGLGPSCLFKLLHSPVHVLFLSKHVEKVEIDARLSHCEWYMLTHVRLRASKYLLARHTP